MNTFKEYEIQVGNTWRGVPVTIGELPYLALAINGEAGELAEHVKKFFRDDPRGGISDTRREAILKEAGDVLYYLARLGVHLNSSLQEIADMNTEKLASRGKRGMLSGEGDNR